MEVDMARKAVPAPAGLKLSGKRLWQRVTAEFELAEHERLQLQSACECADTIDRLRARVTREGDIVDGPHGSKANPALTELRQQRITLARLVGALKLPAGLDSAPAKPQHRGVRGVYRLG
jgi:hypothetical protein